MSRRHFSAQCMRDGYAAMGASLKRPRYAFADKGRSVAESIQAERAKAARMAKAMKNKK